MDTNQPHNSKKWGEDENGKNSPDTDSRADSAPESETPDARTDAAMTASGSGTDVPDEHESETVPPATGAPVSPGQLSEGVGGTTGEYGKEPMSMARVLLFGALGLIVGGAIVWFLVNGSLLGEDESSVAVVNGEEITQMEYSDVFEQVASSAGVSDISSLEETQREELRNQVLEILINRTLLEQAARENGFTATGEEIDTQYEQLVEQAGGEEALEQVFAGSRLSEEVLRTDIERQIIIEDYIASTIGEDTLSLEEGEAREFYEGIEFGEQEAIPFDEVRGQIEQRLLGIKQQEHVDELVASLREDAEIKVNI